MVTNEELAARINSSDNWIVTRTGIRQRQVAAEGEVTSDLGPDQLSAVADDLASVAQLLAREPVLTRHLADPADEVPDPGVRLAAQHRHGTTHGMTSR